MLSRDRSMTLRRPRPVDLLATAIALTLGQQADAQQAATSSARADSLEEIIVTAQRREERAIDVPISISALDADAIAARGATSIQDLQFTVPGLSIASYGPGSSAFVQLRGVSSIVGRPTVGRYLDEMPMNIEITGPGSATRFVDLERVEVLRGPQPTFYGDGSMGGTIRYVTAKPSMQEMSGAVKVDVSQVQDGASGWYAEGNLDLPLVTDEMGLRLAAVYDKTGGWIDRVATGQEDINGVVQTVFRGSFRAKVDETSELNLMWQHDSAEMDNQHFGTDREALGTVATPTKTDSDIFSMTLSTDLGFADLVFAPGYVSTTTDQVFDISPFYVPFLTAPPPFGFGLPPGFVTEIPLGGTYDTSTFFTEVRLVSKSGGKLTWATGVDYKDAEYSVISTTTTAPNELPFDILSGKTTQTNKIWSLWAEAGYALTDRWSAGLGVRYFHDATNYNGKTVSFGVPGVIQDADTFTSTNPRFNLSFKVRDDWNLYVNAAKGFRSGGFNAALPNLPTFDPESLWSYELGSKGLYFDRKLDVEAAVYYNDWKDVQTNFYTPFGLTVTTNGGNVKGWGVDLSATLRATENLSFGATYGWNNMEYKQVPPNGDKAVGDPPDFAVQMSYSVFADYRHPLSGGAALYGRADFQHSDAAQVTLRSPVFDQVTPLPSHDLLNLRAGVTFGRYDVSVYANNALDDDNAVITAPFGVLFEDLSQMPRVYGLTLQAKF